MNSMEKKKAKSFTLTVEDIQYIEEYMVNHGLKNSSEALRKIIEYSKKESAAKSAAAEVADELERRYKDFFRRLKYSVSTIDSNVQVLLEMMNTFFVFQGVSDYIASDIIENDVLKAARENINDRIVHRQQRKASDKYKYRKKE